MCDRLWVCRCCFRSLAPTVGCWWYLYRSPDRWSIDHRLEVGTGSGCPSVPIDCAAVPIPNAQIGTVTKSTTSTGPSCHGGCYAIAMVHGSSDCVWSGGATIGSLISLLRCTRRSSCCQSSEGDPDGKQNLHHQLLGWTTLLKVFYLPGTLIGATVVVERLGPKDTMLMGLIFRAAFAFGLAGGHSYRQDHTAGFILAYGIFFASGKRGPGNNLGVVCVQSHFSYSDMRYSVRWGSCHR